jgi:hypothetical protein
LNSNRRTSLRQYTILNGHPRTSWNPLEDLKTLKQRTQKTTSEMMGQPQIPPLIRIENDHWVFEKVDGNLLKDLKHKLVLKIGLESTTLGATKDLDTALFVAGKIAEQEGKIVLVESM